MRTALALVLALFCQLAIAGYDIHITKKTHWADEEGPKISFSEWLKYVKADRQIAPDRANTRYEFLVRLRGETFPISYNPRLGELYTKNPSDPAIRKMVEISKKLNAKVQGDDGELYPARP